MAAVNSFFSLFLVEELKWDAVGFMWALASVAEVPFMFLSKRLITRFGALNIMVFGSGAVTIRLLLYALVPMPAGIIVAQCTHCLCYGLFHPAAIAFISSSVAPERRALGMSLYLSLGTGVPNLLGNIAGGFIIEHLGYRVLFGLFAFFPVIAIVLYSVMKRRFVTSRLYSRRGV
jgi:PPP family 3-phenylpropionic acid transporter